MVSGWGCPPFGGFSVSISDLTLELSDADEAVELESVVTLDIGGFLTGFFFPDFENHLEVGR